MATPPVDDSASSWAAHESSVPFRISTIDKPCYTWYKIIGDLSLGVPPVVIIHGGPSAGHAYLLPFSQLWMQYRIPVIFYDQIGCGRSTRLPETIGDEHFWRPSLFVAELKNLVDHLDLGAGPGYHILGHSWGGKVAALWAASRPRGLHRLILANTTASSELLERCNKLTMQQMPVDVQSAISTAVKTQDFANVEYKQAYRAWVMKYLFGMNPLPQVIIDSGKDMEADPTVRKSLYSDRGGDGAFASNGSLRGFTCIDKLPLIAVPTLTYNCEFMQAVNNVLRTGGDRIEEKPCITRKCHVPRTFWSNFSGMDLQCAIRVRNLVTASDIASAPGLPAIIMSLCLPKESKYEPARDVRRKRDPPPPCWIRDQQREGASAARPKILDPTVASLEALRRR
ncbi:hypothetical protein ANO11243_080450 [Dothideomycetidae sp. 11243]|nr:hypothetical protein ANO11243_080450 [fungal sp. No.11243]